jgi:hypothetical protein
MKSSRIIFNFFFKNKTTSFWIKLLIHVKTFSYSFNKYKKKNKKAIIIIIITWSLLNLHVHFLLHLILN